MRFVDLFAGMGGFHRALESLGHECVFASESDDDLRRLYVANYPSTAGFAVGDIRLTAGLIPAHDVLCAGFPCQPFSKSGYQDGELDETRGTLFYDVLKILKRHRPEYVFLENVGNFQRHDGGRTWRVVRRSLERLGYDVQATEHFATGGTGLLSPHHLGYPQHRERFFVVGRLTPWEANVLPVRRTTHQPSLLSILQQPNELTHDDVRETRIAAQHERCIETWNCFLKLLPDDAQLPSFPLWGDEFGAKYPFERTTPARLRKPELIQAVGYRGLQPISRAELLERLPSYARADGVTFPDWKVRFIRQNRRFWTAYGGYLPGEWRRDLRSLEPCLRKLEWNCQGELRDLWEHVLQFRPSGLRVKRMTASPALVAMTTTQIPVVGPVRRHLTRVEGLRLQGFPDDHVLPASRAAAFRALGNAVHVGVVRAIAAGALLSSHPDFSQQMLTVQAS